jgi:hypothetical protein
MNNFTSGIPGPAESTSANNSGSSPSTLEITLGVFALVFGLAAVTVAILQFHQGRADLLAQAHRESGQPDVETPDYMSHDSDVDSVRTTASRCVCELTDPV